MLNEVHRLMKGRGMPPPLRVNSKEFKPLEELLEKLGMLVKNFDLQQKRGTYRLILEGAKDFEGNNPRELLYAALEYLRGLK